MEQQKSNQKTWVFALIGVILVAVIVLLVKNSGSETPKEPQAPGFEIQTPYIALKYPEKWQDSVRTEITGTDTEYFVTFYSLIAGKEDTELFSVFFNQESEFLWGTLKTEEGKDISVGFSFAELNLDEGWTQEETETVYAMQEDVNYLLDDLSRKENFKEA